MTFAKRYDAAVSSVTIIYASTSGHTEYVVQKLAEFLHSEKLPVKSCQLLRVENAKPEDLTSADLLILASGTWNTGGIEGQLNPYMHEFLLAKAKDVALGGKNVAIIALGDERYFYTCRANEHMRKFVREHGGKVIEPVLLVVNEPYGQEEKVKHWAKQLLGHMKGLGTGGSNPGKPQSPVASPQSL